MKIKLSKDPIYNIKSVSEQTGVPPVTLRAWERRYNFPEPQRTESGYRLFSEYDIAALNWLKQQTGEGMSIAQAVKLLRSLIENGQDPLMKGMADKDLVAYGFKSIEQVQPALVSALVNLDEEGSQGIIEFAFSMFSLDQVLTEIIEPTMIEIGERWHSGEISIATEHFATNQCRRYLLNAYEMTAEDLKRGSIVASCAPGELHEMGLLTMTVMLRWYGWNVTYLGANVSLERFAETVEKIKPQMLLFSATTETSSNALLDLIQVLDELPDPKPIIGLGGRAFLVNPSLANRIPGTILGPTADDAIRQIERMLSSVSS